MNSFVTLKSSSPETIDQAQKRLAEQSVILHEVRKEHAGFGMPLIAYTHDLSFGDQLEGHIEELDHLMMAEDIFDSLRRRHVALSHALLPALVEKLAETFSQPISILNLGSGIGLDIINVLQKNQDKVGRVDNYDTNRLAVHLGRHLTAELEGEGAVQRCCKLSQSIAYEGIRAGTVPSGRTGWYYLRPGRPGC